MSVADRLIRYSELYARVDREVPVLADLIRLSGALQSEQANVNFKLRAAALGLSQQQLSRSVALPTGFAATRAATDRYVGPTVSILPADVDLRGRLAALRAQVDGGRTAPDAIIAGYLRLDSDVQTTLNALASSLEHQVQGSGGGSGLIVSLHVLRALAAVLHYRAAQFDDVGRLLSGASPDTVRVALARDTGLYVAATHDLVSAGSPAPVHDWQVLTAGEPPRALDQLFDGILGGRVPQVGPQIITTARIVVVMIWGPAPGGRGARRAGPGVHDLHR